MRLKPVDKLMGQPSQKQRDLAEDEEQSIRST